MTQLLLDEMYGARVISALDEGGLQARALVQEPAQRGMSDEDVLAMAAEESGCS